MLVSPSPAGAVKQRDRGHERGTPSIVVTNFENLTWMIDNYGDEFDGLIVDELTKLKKPGGTAARKLRHFAKKMTWRVGMTGTPLAETGTDLYSQALMLDLGKALGTRFEAFQREYFYPIDYQQRNWEAKPDTPARLAKALRKLVFVADDQDYQDNLPPVENHILTYDMPEKLQQLYDDMGTGVVKANGFTVAAASAGVRAIKQHGIAAGGLYGENDDGGRELVYFDDYKIRAVAALVGYAKGMPVIVCYQYQFELDALAVLYPDAPVLGNGNKIKPSLIDEWNARQHPVLIMHHASAAHGLNLQYPCNVIIHLSPVWGADPWTQCLGRIRRRGQPAEVVHRYVLVARGTKDEDALDGIDTKKRYVLVARGTKDEDALDGIDTKKQREDELMQAFA